MDYLNSYSRFDAAEIYAKKYGWAIIPTKNVAGKKVPAIQSWKEYQRRKPDFNDELFMLWAENPDLNPALVTGTISGIAVIDFDLNKDTKEFSKEAHELMNKLPMTLIAQSGSGGKHYFFKINKVIQTKIGILPGVDLKGEGGYLVLPPSVHQSGNKYQFTNNHKMAEFPYELVEEINSKQKINKYNSNSSIEFRKVKEGERNKTLMRIAGTVYNSMPHKPELAEALVLAYNKEYCDPPLPEDEIKTTLLKSAPRYHPNPNDGNENVLKLVPVSASELLSKKCQEQTWLVDGLVPENGISIISGVPGCYKTFLAMEIAKSVAKGTKLFDTFNTIQSGVLYVDEENGEYLIQQRLKLLNVEDTLPIYTLSLAEFTINEDSVDQLIAVAKEHNCKVVVFDPFVSVIGTRDENNSRDMREVNRYFKRFNKNGITIICIHHNRKDGFLSSNPSQSLRGSSDISAGIDSHLAIDEKDYLITIKQSKLRQALKSSTFQLKVISNKEDCSFEYIGEVEESVSQREEAEELITNLLKETREELNIEEITKRLKATTNKKQTIGRNTVGRAINELQRKDIIKVRNGQRNSKLCSYNFDKEVKDVA